MEENKDLEDNIFNSHLSIIDENPELTTIVAATKMHKDNKSLLSTKFISKLSRGYTFFTVMKVVSYSINEISFILPYCLRKLGIFPFFLLLILLSFSSLYIFYLLIDIIIKHKLYTNYHKIIQEKTNKYLNISYYFVNIIYNLLILIFQNYLYLSICRRIFSFFGLDMENVFLEKIIILSLSIIIIEFPFSLIKFFQKPDILYIIITGLIVILNIIALIFIIIHKSHDDIELFEINYFEGFSKDYFTCFSIIMTTLGWQNQIAKHLESFKIKTSNRYHKVVYLFFIILFFLIIFICFSSTPLISDKGDILIFILDYKNLNLTNFLIIQIMSIIFGLVIHIIIAHHIQLIQENLLLILKLTIKKDLGEEYEINKCFSACFNLFILMLINIISLVIDDISIIIILYGGVLTSLINYFFPTCSYWMMVSENSLVVWVAWLITFIIVSLSLVFFMLKVFF